MDFRQLLKIRDVRVFSYRVFKKLRHEIPVPLAKLLAIGNASPLPSAVKLSTYDGSGQAAHPSVVRFQNRCYMACTPYPYCNDSYENPSAYVWEAEKGWTPIPGLFPLVKLRHIGTEHYSDPCLFRKNGALYLTFRKCERLDSNPADQLYICSTPDGRNWTKPALLIEATSNSLLSPAVACESDSLFCVDYSMGGCDSRLIRYPLSMERQNGDACKIQGLPEGYFVWHIDVSRSQDSFRGLFMLRRKVPEIISKLSLFRYDKAENEWIYERDLPLTGLEEKEIQFIYKSALEEDSDRVICSAQDKKGRFILFEKRICE